MAQVVAGDRKFADKAGWGDGKAQAQQQHVEVEAAGGAEKAWDSGGRGGLVVVGMDDMKDHELAFAMTGNRFDFVPQQAVVEAYDGSRARRDDLLPFLAFVSIFLDLPPLPVLFNVPPHLRRSCQLPDGLIFIVLEVLRRAISKH